MSKQQPEPTETPRRRGRPLKHGERLVSIYLGVPQSTIDQLERERERLGAKDVSDLMRAKLAFPLADEKS
jgi:hypothetical protein